METKIMENAVEQVNEEVVTKVVKNGGLLKGAGIGAGIVLAGYACYKGGKMLINKYKTKKKHIERTVSDNESGIYEGDK